MTASQQRAMDLFCKHGCMKSAANHAGMRHDSMRQIVNRATKLMNVRFPVLAAIEWTKWKASAERAAKINATKGLS